MARRSFRDRFWSPPVARAVTAPSSILLAGGAAAVGIVATAPLSLPLGVVAGVVAAGLAYGGRVLAAVPRNTSATAGIDPFAVQEPWRRFVADALAARRRFDEAVRAMDAGPLRDRLAEIGDRLDDGLQETWRVARRGHTLSGARGRVDTGALEAELADAEARQATSTDPRAAQVAEAIRSQLASAQRMQGVIEDAVTTLRLLDARLDESVTRAIELSTGTGPAAHATAVGGDVEGIVSEMEALRLALDDAGAASGGTAAGGTPAPSP
ncbi:MAG TPA: hypothetical protein VK507_13350 [Iamia sp.]|nr:hypothetical protein [Iamia sp.]